MRERFGQQLEAWGEDPPSSSEEFLGEHAPPRYEPSVVRPEVPTDDELVQRGHAMLEAVQGYAAALQTRVPQEYKETSGQVLNASHAWLPETALHMLKGLPLTVAPPMPYGGMSFRSSRLAFEVDSTSNAQPAAWRTARLLRALHPDPHGVRIATHLHDIADPRTGRRFEQRDRDRIADSSMQFVEKHMRGSAYLPGQDVVIARAGSLDTQANRIIGHFQAAFPYLMEAKPSEGTRKLATRETSIKEMLHGTFPKEWNYPDHLGTWLTEYDRPTPAVLEAAALLAQNQPHAKHLRLRGNEWMHDVLEGDALLRLMGTFHRDLYQTVGLDTDAHEDVQVYAFVSAWEQALRQCIQNLEGYDSFQQMDAAVYLEHCYGELVDHNEHGVLPEDLIVLKRLAQVLPQYLGAPDTSLSSLSLGTGPFSFLNMVVAPWTKEQEWSDLAASNVAFLAAYKHYRLEARHDVGAKFEQILTTYGGDIFQGCDKQSRQTSLVTSRSMEEAAAAQGKWDIVLDNFLGCSYSPFRDSLDAAVRYKLQAMSDHPRSLMIAVHMVESEGWDYAGGGFGAAKLSATEIVQAYEGAGMEVLEFLPATPDGQWREGQKGTALIIARRKPGVRADSRRGSHNLAL